MAIPAKVEGLRPKAKRLMERGWALQARPGVFTALAVAAVWSRLGGVRPGGCS